MKILFTLVLLVFSAAAFASIDNQMAPVATETVTATSAAAKKASAKTVITDQERTKPVPKRSNCTTCTGIDPRLDLGGYFVEFVNRNNLKLVKLLLRD
jgi:hypothetical protein